MLNFRTLFDHAGRMPNEASLLTRGDSLFMVQQWHFSSKSSSRLDETKLALSVSPAIELVVLQKSASYERVTNSCGSFGLDRTSGILGLLGVLVSDFTLLISRGFSSWTSNKSSFWLGLKAMYSWARSRFVSSPLMISKLAGQKALGVVDGARLPLRLYSSRCLNSWVSAILLLAQ